MGALLCQCQAQFCQFGAAGKQPPAITPCCKKFADRKMWVEARRHVVCRKYAISYRQLEVLMVCASGRRASAQRSVGSIAIVVTVAMATIVVDGILH